MTESERQGLNEAFGLNKPRLSDDQIKKLQTKKIREQKQMAQDQINSPQFKQSVASKVKDKLIDMKDDIADMMPDLHDMGVGR